MQNAKKKHTLLLATIVLVAGCAGAPRTDMRGVPTYPESLGNSIYSAKAGKATNASDAGMIHIERHTAGYTISMVLDATEDNVYFVMDLPEEKKASDDNAVDELKGEETDAQKPSTTADKAESAAERPTDATQSSKHLVYAQTYFFEKKYARALDEVNRAIEYSPNSAVAYSLKGSVHYKRGESEAARTAWEKALELDPSMDNVNAMLQKVK